MITLTEYLKFEEENGRPLSEINPGSKERALKVREALQAATFLYEAGVPIYGGDVLFEKDDKLKYSHQHEGHTLVWSSDQKSDESDQQYKERSYNETLTAIKRANEIISEKGYEALFVLVAPVTRLPK